MDHLDFLKIAENLKDSKEEAGRRSAVSRSYYAAFHHVRLYLMEERIHMSNDGTEHEKIPRYLKYSGLKNAKDVGKRLDELKDDRREADYKIDPRDLRNPTIFDLGKCGLLILKATQIICDFDSCKGKELINGIKKYINVEKGLPS
jgi:uncharacterized protein (UPF0332 family)